MANIIFNIIEKSIYILITVVRDNDYIKQKTNLFYTQKFVQSTAAKEIIYTSTTCYI